MPHRADAERRAGGIHADMFQDLLLSEFVLADLTIDNPNVWYEIGVRHALRASGVVLTYSLRDRLPFDLAGQRMLRYGLKNGVPDPDTLDAERAGLTIAITETLGAWRGRKASPVYALMPNLQEPDWRSLRIGDVNEFWQGLEAWQSRINIARDKQRPGDILVFAEETPNRVLEFEALRSAADALIKLRRPKYALTVLERARAMNPDDMRAWQLEGIALGRDDRFEEAKESLRRLADQRSDGETLGLLARTWKDQWIRLWRTHPVYSMDPLTAARNTAATLDQAVQAYVRAFETDPDDYYPGINALLFGHLWEHLSGRNSAIDLLVVSAGVQWAVHCALRKAENYWSLVTRAERALLEQQRQTMLDSYAEAVAFALQEKDAFALDSSRQTLDMLCALQFRTELAGEAKQIIVNAERQLRLLSKPKDDERPEPARVVLFSGHLVDKPARPEPRFPEAKADTAGARIAQELDELGATAGDLGISQAGCGGDLLFAHACLARGMRLEIYLPQREPEFLRDSVSYAADRWQDRFDELKNRPDVLFYVMPDELGRAPAGVSIYERCNKWMLHSALSCGLRKMSYIALWDGKPGDGPGGTEHMVEQVLSLTGRRPRIIAPAHP
jgi:tetratricopeptide (TPR) repeat protein